MLSRPATHRHFLGIGPLEMYDHAVANGLHFDWLTFDEGYGGKPELLRQLSARGQRFVAEVPRNFMGWVKPPRVIDRPYHKHGRGRGRKVPRLASGSPASRRVEEMLELDGQAPAVLPGGRGRPAGRASAPDRRP